MQGRRRLLRLGWFVVAILAIPTLLQAQSIIAGVARDESGAVLPGVTVEAASPVLIEKVRTAITDDAGLYRIIDLRPGVYTVTFTLPGFSPFVREGLELPANFTATVNGDLKVGSLQETVTVSGASPVIDLQSASAQQVLSRNLIDAVPTGRSLWSIGAMVPGVTLSGQDVGGSRGMQQLTITARGSDGRDTTVQVDGMITNSFQLNVQQYYNDQMFEEMNYQTGAISAETAGAGVRINLIPKEGGNTFKGTIFSSMSPQSWTSNNITPELVARGLSAPGAIKWNRDLSGGIGGPIMKNKLWFFFSGRRWGVDQFVNNSFYNLDPTGRTYRPDFNRQVVDDNLITSGMLRLTYSTGKNKFSAYLDRINKFRGHECGSLVTEEACGVRIPRIYYTAQAKYTGTLTNRLLVESGISINNESFSTGDRQPGLAADAIARTDVDLGTSWGAPTVRNNRFPEVLKSWYNSVTYVTGTHTFKAGANLSRGIEGRFSDVGVAGVNDLVQEYRSYVPSQVVVYNTPVAFTIKSAYDLGIYVQDTWTKKRLTLSPGVRMDLFDTYYTAQNLAAGRFIGPRSFPEQPESTRPNWRDISPRLGAVYDLFGDGTTALKGSFGKYMRTYHATFSEQYTPAVTTTDRRTWNDLNGDDIAQGNYFCDINQTWNTPGCEIGPTQNTNFGRQIQRSPVPGIKRPYNTEASMSIQRQIVPGMSISFGYTRRTFYREIYTQNIAVQPLGTPLGTGYNLVQVPNPIAPGETIPVYNLKPELRGRIDRLDLNSDTNRRWFNAYELNFQSRVLGGTIFGGASWGQQLMRNCDQEDPNYTSTSLSGLRFCDQTQFGMPFRSQYKLSGTYPLPFKVAVSATFQSNAAGVLGGGVDQSQNRNYNISAATFRNITGGQTLTQPSVIVRLLQPGTTYTDRVNQLDIRFTKRVEFGRYRLEGRFDIFNAMNANPVVAYVQTHGANYQRVSDILSGRVIAAGGTFSF